MPFSPSPAPFIEVILKSDNQGLLIRAQAPGAQTTQPERGADFQTLPQGQDRPDSMVGYMGMMISGLIVLFGVVMVIRQTRKRK